MRNSPAWRCLDGNDKLILERLEEEHLSHGGRENGKLKVTYSNFVDAGVRRAAISTCLAKVEALGFVGCTDHGRASRSEFRFPASYRLTYLPGNTPQTHDWKSIVTVDEAQRRIKNALAAKDARTASLRKQLEAARSEKVAAGRRAA